MATRERTGKQPQKKTVSGKQGAGGATRAAEKPKTGTRAKSGTGKPASGKTKRVLATQVPPTEPVAGTEPAVPTDAAPQAQGADMADAGVVLPAPDPVATGDTVDAASAPLVEGETRAASEPVEAVPEPVSAPPTPLRAPDDGDGLPSPDGPREVRSAMTTDAEIASAAVREKAPEAAMPADAADEEAGPRVAVVADSSKAPADAVAVPEVALPLADAPVATPPEAEPVEDRTREGEAQLVATYLAGALEGLAGQVISATAVHLDPALADLALEKLQYFGQVLHLLAEAVDFVDTRQTGHGKAGIPPRLCVRLEQRAAGRLALRCFDDGRFFERALPKMRLDMEALRPLVLAVARAGGSICLRRGRCVEFEITG